MKVSGIKLRWLDSACYEIVLPNGKVLVTDPYTLPLKERNFNATEFTGADYIICTHSHYDHTADIGYLTEKYNSKVFVGQMAAKYLADFYKINYNNLYPFSINEEFIMEDFKLHIYRAKHNLALDQSSKKCKSIANPDIAKELTRKQFNLENYAECDQYGWMESYDFLITTNNNIRILFVSGESIFDNIYKVSEKDAPNIVIRQASTYENPEDFADAISRFGCQLAFPHHHEILKKKYGQDKDEYMEKASMHLKKSSSQTILINPKSMAWYEVATTVNEKDD